MAFDSPLCQLIGLLTFCGIPTLSFAASSATAESDAALLNQNPLVFQLFWENDGTVARPGGTDRHYTNGIGFSVSQQSDWAAHFTQHLPFQARQAGQSSSAFGVLVGHEIYTPSNLRLNPPDPDDHPYAGYAYTGLYLQRQVSWQNPDTHTSQPGSIDAIFDHVQLDIGLVGPSAKGDQIQSDVHQHFSEIIPQGWDAQLEDEPTFNLTWIRKWRANVADFDLFGQAELPVTLQAIPQINVRLGTVHTDIEGGAIFRLGQNLTDDFGPGFLHDPMAATGQPQPGLSWSIYAGATLRAVAHDIFLDGGTFKSGPSVDKEPLVARLHYGLSVSNQINPSHQIGLNWGQWVSSHTFETQKDSDGMGRVAVWWQARF